MDAHSNATSGAGRLGKSPDRSEFEAAGQHTATTDTPNGIKSSPPPLSHVNGGEADSPSASHEEKGEKSDSEAETIVLPGKDGHSPKKRRRSIKHEDKSDDEQMSSAPEAKGVDLDVIHEDESHVGGKPSESTTATSTLGKRKRPKHGAKKDDSTAHGNSSGLSSVPTSPVATTRSSLSKRAASDSDISKSPSPRPHSAVRDKARSVDRTLPRKKRYEPESGEEDDIEEPRSVRQRSSGTVSKARKITGSISPQPRGHRRSISSQLPAKSSSYGLSHKKKRVPAPLQSTEYQSDDSSASGSSYPRSSRLRSLAAPNTGDSTISPIKMGSHKKHVNSSGQTQFARACGTNKLDIAMQRYQERPEDLNETDHAGNAPLHSASISGHVQIVKFLLETGHCVVDPLNIIKDTPLHDALENCHVDVVKLLLDHGANPRKPKGDGKDPLDIIADKEDQDKDDDEMLAEWKAMRKLITVAMKKSANVRHDSEDDRMQDAIDGRLSHPIESPRHTPPIPSNELSSISASTRRVGTSTSRQVKTRDGNLYQPMNLNELRKAARDGDTDTTARILEVMPNSKDPKTLWLAARGGHKDVMEFQLALGKFDADPWGPLEGAEPGKDTPLLVAIGRGNHLDVIKLLLTQNIDPTRIIDGETYFEIAERRKGANWQDEVALLKEAFNNHKKSPKASPKKSRSPDLRRDNRDSIRDSRRSGRRDEPPAVQSHKKSVPSPKAKESPSNPPRHRRNSSFEQAKDGQATKRGPGRPRKDEGAIHTTGLDREPSPLGPPKQKSQMKKSESDVAVISDNELTAKPRRKLISGKEYRGERDLEKQRRTSVVSNTSSASVKDKVERRPTDSKLDRIDGRASPSIPRSSSKHGEHDGTSEKHASDKDRARSLKRDDSKDRLSAIRGESPVKRPRKSETPPHSSAADSSNGGSSKRRKLEGESSHSGRALSESPENHMVKPKSNLSRESSAARSIADGNEKASRSSKSHNETTKEAKGHSHLGDSAHSRSIKSTAPSNGSASSSKSSTSVLAGISDITDEHSATAKASKEAAAEEARIQKEKEEREEREEREAIRKKEEEEKKEQARIEEAKQARLARERAAKEEEEQREREQAERKERQRIEDAEARLRAAEQQRALYLEQEKIKREEQERRRAIAQEQQRVEKARLEKLKTEKRLAKLPLLLRWFDLLEDAKTAEIASLFRIIAGFRYDTIRSEFSGQANGREQWMLNTQVATLLGEKDLQLSRYTAWERIPLTEEMKRGVWKTENDSFTLRSFSLPLTLRKFFPGNGTAPLAIAEQNKALFLELDLFFVKVSEFMYIVPNFPHLRSIEMEVQYRELILPLCHPSPLPSPKWKSDPETVSKQPFAPRSKYYKGGKTVRDGEPLQTKVLNTPPTGDDRVPRRGLVRVYPGESDYEEICKRQGLHHFLSGTQISPSSSTNPHMNDFDQQPQQVNGFTPPGSDSKSLNGGSPRLASVPEAPPVEQLPNGVMDHDGGDGPTAEAGSHHNNNTSH